MGFFFWNLVAGAAWCDGGVIVVLLFTAALDLSSVSETGRHRQRHARTSSLLPLTVVGWLATVAAPRTHFWFVVDKWQMANDVDQFQGHRAADTTLSAEIDSIPACKSRPRAETMHSTIKRTHQSRAANRQPMPMA